MNSSVPDNDYRRAIHEIGHTLVGFGLGCPVEIVSLRGGSSDLGVAGVLEPDFWTAIKAEIDPVTKSAFELHLAGIAAGSAAEWLVFGNSRGHSADEEQLQVTLDKFTALGGLIERLCVKDWQGALGLAGGLLSYHFYHSKSLQTLAEDLVSAPKQTFSGSEFTERLAKIHDDQRKKFSTK